MSDPMTRLKAVPVISVGLVLLLVLVVLLRAASDLPGPTTAAQGEATEAPAGVERVNADPAQQAPGGTIAATPAETEPPVRTGCFRSGSSRAEVRRAMGEPDAVVFGVWEYGQSWVTFGYGQVLDFSNEGGNLRLCESDPQ